VDLGKGTIIPLGVVHSIISSVIIGTPFVAPIRISASFAALILFSVHETLATVCWDLIKLIHQ
jgi:uncharacterized membrane protein